MAEPASPTLEARRAQTFPILAPDEIARLHRFGAPCRYAAGARIYETGKPTPGMLVVLSGTIRITGRDGHGHDFPVVDHVAGAFSGELGQLSSRRSLVDAVAVGDVEALLISPEQLHALLIAEAALGEKVMRAHDLLAERGLRDQQGMQLLRADEQRLDVADRDRVHERAPARKLSELAGKGSRDVIDHRKIMPVPVAAGDADRPRKHDQHAGGRLARLIDPRAGRIAARRAEAPQACDLVGGEDRESLRAARFERRRRGLSHCRGAGASL